MRFAGRFDALRLKRFSLEWFEPKLRSVAETDSDRARLLTSLPFTADTWDRAEGLGLGAEAAYWAETPVYGPDGPDEVMRGAWSLVRYGGRLPLRNCWRSKMTRGSRRRC
jgi:hypothetical protein